MGRRVRQGKSEEDAHFALRCASTRPRLTCPTCAALSTGEENQKLQKGEVETRQYFPEGAGPEEQVVGDTRREETLRSPPLSVQNTVMVMQT